MQKRFLFLFALVLSFAAAPSFAQMTRFPHGVSSFGIPQMGEGYNIPNRIGIVWFVDGTNGTNGSCQTPTDACKTVTLALTKAHSGTGDTVIIYPGSYVENIVVTKDYITLRCAQFGYAKPDVVPTSGLALTVAAQGFQSICMRYAAPATDTDLVRQEGNGFFYIDNVFDGDAAQGNAKALLLLKGNDTDDSMTASEGVIQHNLFRGSGGDGIIFDTAEPAVGVGETDDVVIDNTFQAIDQVAIATADTGPGTYSIQVSQIIGNYFVDKNKATLIDLTTSNGGAASAQTGVIAGNWLSEDTVNTTVIKMVGTGFTAVGNYYTGTAFVDGNALD
jgi:hypothetical protein